MSAPTPAPGDDRPREGYYPDPSIPGYVRYWNGAAWVPGTSRPAPSDGEPLAPPPGSGHGPGAAGAVEETGPHFFDEDPDDEAARPASDTTLHGSRPEPASAWGADRSRQTGFGDTDRRVSWGSPPPGSDPRDPRVSLAVAADTGDDAADSGHTASTDGTATIPPADADDGTGAPEGTVVFRRPNTSGQPGAAEDTEPARSDGTMPFRPSSAPSSSPSPSSPLSPSSPSSASSTSSSSSSSSSSRVGQQGGGTAASAPGGAFGAPPTSAQLAAQQALGLTRGSSPSSVSQTAPSGPQPGPQGPQPGATAQAVTPAAPALPPAPVTPTAPTQPQPQPPQPQFGGPFPQQAAPTQQPAQPVQPAPTHQPVQPVQPVQPAQPLPGVPQQGAAPQSSDAPMSAGPGGGQPSWVQQVHRLAGGEEEEQLVAPWKPVVEDPFQAVARRQSEARPAGLGRRLAARLVDSLVVGAVTAGAAVPFGTKTVDHVNDKIDAAKLSGEKVTVWLLDGTTSVYLGIILGVLFLVSALYEVLPTAKWGRTLGKKLLGIDVRDIEGHEPPSFGRSLRRWLVHTVSGLLGIGVIGVLWCMWDRPWRQCWHDKAAHTFVAGR